MEWNSLVVGHFVAPPPNGADELDCPYPIVGYQDLLYHSLASIATNKLSRRSYLKIQGKEREGGRKERNYEGVATQIEPRRVLRSSRSEVRNGKRTAGSSLVLEAPESVRLCFLSFMRPRAQPELPERATDGGERLLAGWSLQ